MRFFLPFACVLLTFLPGCVCPRYTRTVYGTGTNRFERVTFSCPSLFADEKATKIAIDKATSKTTTGVTIGTIETDIDDQAVQAVVSGVVQGVVKGLK